MGLGRHGAGKGPFAEYIVVPGLFGEACVSYQYYSHEGHSSLRKWYIQLLWRRQLRHIVYLPLISLFLHHENASLPFKRVLTVIFHHQ
jgi:hypothetical protein